LDRRYWDSSCIFNWLYEQEGFESCRGTLEKAKAGELEIVTSALTIAEVLYLKTKGRIDKERSLEVHKFFAHEFILIQPLDRFIAESARDIVWEYNVHPKDAVHVASALWDKIPILNTFDLDLLNKDGIIGDPPLKIIKPDIIYEDKLFETEEK